MKLSIIALVITATFTALMSGFFFAYSVSVSLGLGKLGDKEFIASMQSINREVQNPVFFICFFGTMVMLSFASYLNHNQYSLIFLLIACLFYFLGVIGITVLKNVPLNKSLEMVDLAKATEISAEQLRNSFEKRWNFWNNMRSICSLVTSISVILACVFTNVD